MDIRDMFDKITDMLNDKESNDDARRKQAFETLNKGFYKKLYLNPPYKDDEMDKSDDKIKTKTSRTE